MKCDSCCLERETVKHRYYGICLCDDCHLLPSVEVKVTWRESEKDESEYEKAADALHEAARNFTKAWLKAPRESSFKEWFDECDKLESAALAFAKAKAHNSY